MFAEGTAAALPHQIIYRNAVFSAVRAVADAMTPCADSTPHQSSRLDIRGSFATLMAIRRASSAARSGTRVNL
jgi:hypothetical protein